MGQGISRPLFSLAIILIPKRPFGSMAPLCPSPMFRKASLRLSSHDLLHTAGAPLRKENFGLGQTVSLTWSPGRIAHIDSPFRLICGDQPLIGSCLPWVFFMQVDIMIPYDKWLLCGVYGSCSDISPFVLLGGGRQDIVSLVVCII